METALYYTFSTISQTLAGALGMLAAFLVLRVSALEETFNAGARELERMTSQWGAKDRLSSAADVIEYWRSVLTDAQGAAHHLAILAAIRRANDLRRATLAAARGAFIASAFVMGACFVGLAASPTLGRSTGGSFAALAFAISCGIGCLLWYGRIVQNALE